MMWTLRSLFVVFVIGIVGCGGSNTGVEMPKEPAPPPTAPPQNTGVQPPSAPSVE
jgi:hypothetical protein